MEGPAPPFESLAGKRVKDMKIDVRMRGAMMSSAGVLGNMRMLSRGVGKD